MVLGLFSCLSFLWPVEEARGCDACDHDFAAPRVDSCSLDCLAPLLHRINDPPELRRVLRFVSDGGVHGRISLSRLFLPIKLHCPGPSDEGGCRESGGDRGEEAEEGELLVDVDDVMAAVTEADLQGCLRSLVSAFEFFDRDGDGVISTVDLLLALRDVLKGEEDQGGWQREALSAAACEEMVAAFDWERVGGVCFTDFVRMMTDPHGENCRPSGRRPPFPDHGRILKQVYP